MQKTNSLSLCTLVVGLSGASFWGIVSAFLFKTAKNQVIISMIIGFLLSLIIVKTYLSFFNKSTFLNLYEKMKIIYGKFSIVINTIICLSSIMIYIFFTYRLTSFLSSQYLIETPKIFLHSFIILSTLYMAKNGIESIARISVLSLILALILYVFDGGSLIQYIKIDNYLPMYDYNIMSIIKSSCVFAAFFSIPTIYICFNKKDDIVDKEKFNKTFLIYYIISFIVILSSVVITLGVFGINLTLLFDYPLYTVLKRITLFSFIDSVENVSVMLWILYVINASNIVIDAVVNLTKQTFKIKKDIWIYISLFIISIVVPRALFAWNNFTESFKYLLVPLSVYLVLFLIILISLFIGRKKL